MGWKLPALSTIRKWMTVFDFRTGINEKLMSCLSERVESMGEKEKDCIITWDEVSIKEYVEYDRNKDEIIGIVDHGLQRRKLDTATEALVIMIQGINTNWKFPISYYFSSGNTTSEELDGILIENMKKLKDIGIKIRLGVCDMSFTNQGLYRKWNVTKDRPFIMLDNEKIFMIHDAPHLIKLVRNNLQKRNFIIGDKQVKWYWIQRFWKLDCRRVSRMAPKLTKFHFYLKDFSNMKVKLATQVFSQSVFAGMFTMIKLRILKEDAMPTAKLVKDMDSLFDLLNISEPQSNKTIKSGNSLKDNMYLFDHFCKFDIEVVGTETPQSDNLCRTFAFYLYHI